MRALRLERHGAPLVERTIPDPVPGPGDVVVRVRAAGICHSDAHYRSGNAGSSLLPRTLGHEVAGVVAAVGAGVTSHRVDDRVCLHYLVSCGQCEHCIAGREQFCPTGQMLGNNRDGGYAEFIVVPARNAVALPADISFEHGAVMMCSSATSLHALRRGRLVAGERVAVIGVGGLGISAVQLAQALGAAQVFAIDLDVRKLETASTFGAIPILAGADDVVQAVRDATNGRGVDLAVELIGAPETMQQAVRMLGVQGRAAIVGLSRQPLVIDAYRELLGPETEIIGVNDHLLAEMPLLIEFASTGRLDLSSVVTQRVPLEANAVNRVLDDLDAYRAPLRTVISDTATDAAS